MEISVVKSYLGQLKMAKIHIETYLVAIAHCIRGKEES